MGRLVEVGTAGIISSSRVRSGDVRMCGSEQGSICQAGNIYK